MILIDTHVLVWFATGQRWLGARSKALIEQDEAPCVSAMTFWELSMLTGKGRLAFELPLHRWFETTLSGSNIAEVPVTGQIGLDAGALTGIHGDPCDRLIIATARSLGCTLLTADEAILRYAAAGHVRAIDARV